MLSKGLRDEDNEKIDEALQALLKVEFIPDYWEKQQRQNVSESLQSLVKLSLNEVETISKNDLLQHLHDLKLEFSNYEQLGDLLLKIAPLEENNQQNLAKKTLAIYEHAQQESKMFSFGLIQKITNAQALAK
ncbi:hypothetical protein ACG2LH_03650 [Zhouia sp. PK063]|uniref:hypothetical protein n=1 Tax=Zhouia sp. PK063 TaxID=3373602 RepID=UPI00379EB55D